MKLNDLVKAKCVEVECPHWGLIKIGFDALDFYWWEDCRDSGLEITFKCVCGEQHEILRY
jgi:hypothetical protein